MVIIQPIIELPNALHFFKHALLQRIYPNLRNQFGFLLPEPQNLRVADGFIVKYDANQGQRELKPHRDGSVLSFNIALNPSNQYEGGGTWFASLAESKNVIQLQQGEMMSHASALLHGGHAITSGMRYILVAFVILEDYDSWSMRFYNQVRNL
jgi:predicted 2-oxoglutarate/Fe(II)-dependent dioxygenase YbiX